MPWKLKWNRIQSKSIIVDRPKLAGITGGIGSGKTTICKIFQTLGVNVYYADDRAKYLMETNGEIADRIMSIFGEDAYIEGKPDRLHIAKLAFENKELLTRLNKAIHPAVQKDFEEWVNGNSTETMLLKEAALLIETGSYEELDKLILVTADQETRVSRILPTHCPRHGA